MQLPLTFSVPLNLPKEEMRLVGGEACKGKTKGEFWHPLFSNCICLCGGLTLVSSQTPIQPLAHPCLLRNREEIEGRQKDKSIKLVTV